MTVVIVRSASAAEIMPLRQAVLRPALPASAAAYPEDASAVHLSAWAGGDLVGCGTVFAQPWPGPPLEPAAWRLRGMAVAPGSQGQGIGSQVLAAVVEAVAEAGATVMWANARMSALGFYLRHGWEPAGAEFVTTDTGLPHVPILRKMSYS